MSTTRDVAHAVTEKDRILLALRAWINQRPGLEFGNYGERKAYRSELRSITQDRRDAMELLRSIELSSMPAETLKEGFQAFSGRLTYDTGTLSYCTGQYWPTEYRKAVCAVAASALWTWYREEFCATAKGDESPGDAIRRNFRRLYGRRLANRWFN